MYYLDLQKDIEDVALLLGAIEKIGCHILNCLAALSVIQTLARESQIVLDDEKHESVKRKVFNAACSMMIETELDNDEVVITTLLSAFPDSSKMSDKKGGCLCILLWIAQNHENSVIPVKMLRH